MSGHGKSCRRLSRPLGLFAGLTFGLAVPIGSLPLMAGQDENAAGAAGQTAGRQRIFTRDGQLTPQGIQEGWIRLFDGETSFGWKTEGAVEVKEGTIRLGGDNQGGAIVSTTAFSDFELRVLCSFTRQAGDGAALVLNGHAHRFSDAPGNRRRYNWLVRTTADGHTVSTGVRGASAVQRPGPSRTPVEIRVGSGNGMQILAVVLKPLNLKPIFNGKDLAGWKPLPDRKSVFSVTDKGELNVKNGNGDLQSEGQYQDFVLQLDVISNGKQLNSGIFFRALPGEFWQGYEAQIRNQWEGDDRTRPVDFGTGGVYNRQKSRKVVSSDHEWFTYTIAADGPHIALWVNGYQTADYIDEQPEAASARKGRYTGKGSITIQGHDPTTDLSFRNIRIAELPRSSGASAGK